MKSDKWANKVEECKNRQFNKLEFHKIYTFVCFFYFVTKEFQIRRQVNLFPILAP